MVAREKPIPIKFSAQTKWFLDALVESGRYGETKTEVIRRFVLEGIGRAQDLGHLPRPVRELNTMPKAKHPEDT